MFQFTNRYGEAIDAPALSDVDPVDATDVRYLPLWVAAAVKAEEDGYLGHYDRIAEATGGPTSTDLRDAGLMPATFSVTLQRRVPVLVWVDQQVTVEVKANDVEAANVKAMTPGVTYWPGGMYGDTVIGRMTDKYGYRGLFVSDAYPIGEVEVVAPDTGV
jgi:hypothetical protein